MSKSILDKIFAASVERVEAAKNQVSSATLREAATRNRRTRGAFRKAVTRPGRINIIAEFKRASPSKGVIAGRGDAGEIAEAYERGGACAVSVLTEADHFCGSLSDLARVREKVSFPILRKDFIFDEYQIWEAAAAGADAVLLIAAMLDDVAVRHLCSAAFEVGLDVLLEVHTPDEMSRAGRHNGVIIGVNNRDLKTFAVDLDTSRRLVEHAPAGAVLVSESGFSDRSELEEMRQIGYSAFLVGESLMRSGERERTLRELTGRQT